MSQTPTLRSDARRNRDRILETAQVAFATGGLTVPVQEIARLAGVSTGTVSRHFPTKENLFEAILHRRMNEMIEFADDLLSGPDAGPSFFEFVDTMIRAGAGDRGFADRLAASAADRRDLGARISADVLCDRLETLFERAQTAHAVRSDVSLGDVEALMEACMARPESLDPMIDTVMSGLRA